ncbi:MAG: deoxyribonuclease IV [Isosphaeraceae bacterium]
MTRTRRPRTGCKTSSCKFGAHMSIAGGYERALLAAHALGCQTVQLFTKNNNQWNAPPISAEQSALFRKTREQTGILDPVAHSSYLINLASPDDALWKKSIEAMVHEVQRCSQLGIADLVVHPGAHTGSGEEAGLLRVAKALDEIRDRTGELGVTIDLETTAGQGTTLGHRFEHLQAILGLVADSRGLGICLDSCHIFAAGYSLDAPERYDEVIEQVNGAVGIDRLRVWHLNDSCRECGSRVDRHAGIGSGCMGLEPFRYIVKDPRFRHLPMILETPKGTEDGEELDARNLRILRQLAAS